MNTFNVLAVVDKPMKTFVFHFFVSSYNNQFKQALAALAGTLTRRAFGYYARRVSAL